MRTHFFVLVSRNASSLGGFRFFASDPPFEDMAASAAASASAADIIEELNIPAA